MHIAPVVLQSETEYIYIINLLSCYRSVYINIIKPTGR